LKINSIQREGGSADITTAAQEMPRIPYNTDNEYVVLELVLETKKNWKQKKTKYVFYVLRRYFFE